jgi:hypothetical protein
VAKEKALTKKELKLLRARLVSLLTAIDGVSFSNHLLIQTVEELVPNFERTYRRNYEAAMQLPRSPASDSKQLDIRLIDGLIQSLAKKKKKA